MPAPEPQPQRAWSWLAFLAGAGLAAAAYMTLREPEPPARPRSALADQIEARALRHATTARSDHTPHAPTDDPRATVEPVPSDELDAGVPIEWPALAENEPSPLDTEPASPEVPPSASKRRPDAGPPHPALPHGHPPLGAPPPEPEPEIAAGLTAIPSIRRVEITVIRRWQQPGLCDKSGPASNARRTMMAQFNRVAWEPDAVLFVDPRLPRSVGRELFDPLEAAEREIAAQLGLHPSRPDVFAYRDTKLLLAGGCTNDNVVAYYDGDLHVVPTHADVQQSITHEYTHHALMTNGIVAPAWAQEGIAMNVARETWWQTRDWLERVAARPFSVEIMERSVPYTMRSEQALAFYVQSAAMVWCASVDDPEGLQGLVRRLGNTSGGTLEYELPPLAEPSALRACTREILDSLTQ